MALFSATLFLSAALVFLIEPMFATFVRHISNQYHDLERVVGALARSAGLVCRAQQGAEGDWAALAVRRRDLGGPSIDARRHDSRGARRTAWSDAFSNLLGSRHL